MPFMIASSPAATLSTPGFWMPVAINVIGQVTMIVAIAWVADRLLARWNPSQRHAIWLTALVLVLVSPLLAALAGQSQTVVSPAEPLPPTGTSTALLQVPREGSVKLPAPAKVPGAERSERGQADAPRTGLVRRPAPAVGTSGVTSPSPGGISDAADAKGTLIRAFQYAATVWAVGAMLMLARLIWGSIALARFRSSLCPLVECLPTQLLQRARRTLGREKLPLIFESPRLRTPACIGFSNR